MFNVKQKIFRDTFLGANSKKKVENCKCLPVLNNNAPEIFLNTVKSKETPVGFT